MGRSQFYRLVRSWRDHRQPSLLIGSGVAGRQPRRRDYGVDEAAREIAARVIDAVDTDADLAAIALVIEAQCAAVGVRPPSRPTIWTYMMKARSAGEGIIAGPPRIVIGRLWFNLPIADAAEGAVPVMLGAFLLPERLIAAQIVSADPDAPPSMIDLVNQLIARRTEGALPRPLVISVGDHLPASAALAAFGIAQPRGRTRSVQRVLSGAFGSRFGSLPVIYQRSMARPLKRPPPGRLEASLTQPEAVAAMIEAVESNNARRATSGTLPTFDIATSPTD